MTPPGTTPIAFAFEFDRRLSTAPPGWKCSRSSWFLVFSPPGVSSANARSSASVADSVSVGGGVGEFSRERRCEGADRRAARAVRGVSRRLRRIEDVRHVHDRGEVASGTGDSARTAVEHPRREVSDDVGDPLDVVEHAVEIRRGRAPKRRRRRRRSRRVRSKVVRSVRRRHLRSEDVVVAAVLVVRLDLVRRGRARRRRFGARVGGVTRSALGFFDEQSFPSARGGACVGDDDVRDAVRELDAFAPAPHVRVRAEVDARDVELQRLALGPVLVPQRRHEVLAGARRRDDQAAVRVVEERGEQRAADAVARVRERDDAVARGG